MKWNGERRSKRQIYINSVHEISCLSSTCASFAMWAWNVIKNECERASRTIQIVFCSKKYVEMHKRFSRIIHSSVAIQNASLRKRGVSPQNTKAINRWNHHGLLLLVNAQINMHIFMIRWKPIFEWFYGQMAENIDSKPIRIEKYGCGQNAKWRKWHIVNDY